MRLLVLFLLPALLLAACRGAQPGDSPFAPEAIDVEAPAGEPFTPTLDGPLRILSATPYGEGGTMQPGQAVAVTFSKPMVPLGDAPAPPADALMLEPPAEGMLRWEGGQTLVFDPSAPLPPARRYRAQLTSGLQSLDGDTLREPFTWTFTTERPRLVSSDPSEGTRHVDPQRAFRLTFNLPVRAADAEDYVVLRRTDGARAPRLDLRNDGDSVLVAEHGSTLPQGAHFELVVREGLPTTAGPLGSAQEVSMPFQVRERLRVVEVTQPNRWDDDQPFQPERGVTLRFTTPVRFEELRQAVRFEPAVAMPPGIEARDGAVSESHHLPLDLEPSTNYRIVIEDLQDVFGQTLQRAQGTFSTTELTPRVVMPRGLAVVEASQTRALPMRVTNAESAPLGVRRLAQDEIVPLLESYASGWWYDEEATDPVPLTRRVRFDVPSRRPTVVPLALDTLLGPSGTGVVAVRMESPDDETYRALAQITELGLTGKFSPQETLVLVTRLADAAPVAGATVTLRSIENEVLWTGATDEAGRAVGPGWGALGLEGEDRWSKPLVIAFAEHGGDLAFTTNRYDDGIEPWRFDVPYDWRPAPRAEAGTVFSDRGLYQAGETVHLKAIAREGDGHGGWQALRDSVRVLAISPRDEVVLDRAFLPSDLGTFHLDVPTTAATPQGAYRVRLVRAADSLSEDDLRYGDALAEGSYRVDAFRRARFAVEARSALPAYVAGDFFEGAVEARYLFGAPLQEAPARVTLRRENATFQPPGYAGYRFGTFGRAYLYDRLFQTDTTLSESGTLEVRQRLDGNPEGAPARVVLEASVQDPARQELAGQTSALLHPALFYVGLKPQTTFVDLSETSMLPVDVVAVDPNGQPAQAREVRVALVKQQWNSVREVGSDGRSRWRSELIEDVVAEDTVRTEPGRAVRLQLPLTEGGRYVVRATGRDVRGNRVQTEAYLYAAGGGYVAWERTDSDRIDLVADQTRYAPGDVARILVPSPYERATALVTVEREGILSSRVMELEGSAPSIEVPVTESMLPNAFVSVVLLSGRTAQPGATDDPGAPSFRMGYAELDVSAEARHLRVEIEPSQPTYRPGDVAEVAVRLVDQDGRGVPGEIAFSAPDAGVLDLIDYSLPDPFETFYGPRPLAVQTAETRANIILQRNFGQKAEDLGGGGGLEESGSVRRDFRPQAHWAPALRTGRDGRATVRFRLPESLTTFRLMAVGVGAGHRFGQSEQDVIVTQPLVQQPALPRFARLGDQFEAGVLVTNTTGAAGRVTVRAEADGLALRGPAEESRVLADGATEEIRFRWGAPVADSVRVTFRATLEDEEDAREVVLPVLRPTTRRVDAAFASTDSVATMALRLPADRLPDLGRFEARLSSTALVGLDGAMDYLFTYPYGCLEQRTSAVRPLLVARDLLEAFDLEPLGMNRDAEVAQWQADLRDFWTGDGFALWRGGRIARPYVSAYVVLAMAEAEAAGYALEPGLQADAVRALTGRVRRRSDRPRYLDADAWADTRAFLLYALARHDAAPAAELEALASESDLLSPEGTAHLLRAVALADEPALEPAQQRLAERLRSQIRVEGRSAYLTAPDTDTYRWIFASDVRATAHALTALVEAAPQPFDRLMAERMVRYLIAARQGAAWASTQENAAVLDALRAYHAAYEDAEPSLRARVEVAGRELLEARFDGRTLRAETAVVAAGELPTGTTLPVRITTEGEGRAFYSLLVETYTDAPQEAASQGLTVERTLQPLDDRGEPDGPAFRPGPDAPTLRPGQLVQVTLRVQTPTDRHYVAVDDALPAGLEALNAAFATTADDVTPDRPQDRWWGSFEHTELRDDRVLLFADLLARGEHTYRYVARATTPGTFVYPPAEASLMYQPEVSGRTASSTLRVAAPIAP